jgi:hypothetical protein
MTHSKVHDNYAARAASSAPVNGVDQRGYARPGAGYANCSIGAFEYDSPGPPGPCVGDCGGTGSVTVDEIITLVNIALGNAQPSACPTGVPSGAEVDVALIIECGRASASGDALRNGVSHDTFE